MANNHPLPRAPGPLPSRSTPQTVFHADNGPNYYPYPYPNSNQPRARIPQSIYDEPPTSTLRGGTLLHKGFYDLLSMIPTPSPSRFFWGPPPAAPESEPILAGPRYEEILPAQPSAARTPLSPKKARRISKDMVSKPTGFVYVTFHTSYLLLIS